MHNNLLNIQDQVNSKLKQLLTHSNIDHVRLYQAMEYSSLDAGKRLRPFLTLTFSKIFNVDQEYALRAAAAIEMIHCYSLIHDDLPGMDNDDYRRGKLTCHKKFDEAVAILAGDALLTLAFEILSHPETHHDPSVRCELIARTAQSAGKDGMIGGQILDIDNNYDKNLANLLELHKMKTGELFAVSCEVAAILAQYDQSFKNNIKQFGYLVGEAYQIIDDLEDYTNKQEITNIIKIIGIDKAIHLATDLINQAQHILDQLALSDVGINDFINSLRKKLAHGHNTIDQ